MFLAIYKGAFLFGVVTPEKKDCPLFLVGNGFNNGVGEVFPALFLVGIWLVGPNG